MYYLIGGSGAPNYGDELILQHWLRYLHEEVLPGRPAARIVVDNNGVEGSRDLFSDAYPAVDFISSLKVAHPERGTVGFMRSLSLGLGFFSSGRWRHHPELTGAVEQLQQAKLVHLYGGGYINTALAPRSGFLVGMLADAVKHFGIRAVATGIGITPLQFPEKEDMAPFRQALEAFDLFELRDPYGYNRVRQLVGAVSSLVCGQDDAMLYPVPRERGSTGARRLHLSAYKAGNLFDKPVAQAWLERHAQEFDETVYWECAPSRESEVIAGLRERLPAIRVATVKELLFNGVPANPGDHMLTMRYHPHLVAARLGVSGQFVADSVYYEHKHGVVCQMGSGFRRLQGQPAAPHAHESPITWRDAGWVMLKRALAERIYRST
jgi:polysaccharide pyruvyl transferase WcaK-like protein